MKARARLMLFTLGILISLAVVARASDALLPQRILYIGHRKAEFEPVLMAHFAKVQSTARESFQPAAAMDFDVVLLDWPQSEIARQQRNGLSTLGQREQWSKPTVLLGSAGLNLAVVWKLKGGSG